MLEVDPGPLGLGDGGGIVGRAGVHDDDLVDQPGLVDQVAAQAADDAADGRGLVAGRQADRDGQPQPLLGRASLAGGSNWPWWKVRLPNHSHVSMSVIGSPVPAPQGICPPVLQPSSVPGQAGVPQLHSMQAYPEGGGTGPTKPRQPPPDEEGATSGLAIVAGKMRRAVDRPRRDVAPRRAPEVDDRMTDQTLDHVTLRCRGCQTAYPPGLEYVCSRCLGPLDPEYDPRP